MRVWGLGFRDPGCSQLSFAVKEFQCLGLDVKPLRRKHPGQQCLLNVEIDPRVRFGKSSYMHPHMMVEDHIRVVSSCKIADSMTLNQSHLYLWREMISRVSSKNCNGHVQQRHIMKSFRLTGESSHICYESPSGLHFFGWQYATGCSSHWLLPISRPLLNIWLSVLMRKNSPLTPPPQNKF